MTPPLPTTPQTGRTPPPLDAEAERRLLAEPHPSDQVDPFAADAIPAIRKLGRLALRRERPLPADLYALGDLCAREALRGENLLATYIGKAVYAYRRAGTLAVSEADQAFSASALQDFVRWALDVASAIPTLHNLSAALLAAAEVPRPERPRDLQEAVGRVIRQMEQAERLESSEPVEQTGAALSPYTASNSVPNSVSDESRFEATFADHSGKRAPNPYPESERNISPGRVQAAVGESLPESELGEDDDSPTLFEAAERPSQPALTGTGDFSAGQTVESEDGRNRYAISKVLRGGMGVVYVAQDLSDGSPVALKAIQAAFLSAGGTAIRERFYHESLTWIRLGKHPNIVQARTIQTIGGRPHILLEYVAGADGLGTDLRGWIEHRQIDTALALQIALQVAWGMQYAIGQRPELVHRDLKPANILITFDGTAKVTDFGLAYSLADRQGEPEPSGVDGARPNPAPAAKVRDVRLTSIGTILGTAVYMSPEQTRAATVDARADIYALGVIVFEMLTGAPPFESQDWETLARAHQETPPLFPPIAEKAIAEPIRAFTLRCLAKDPAYRPQDWRAVALELTRLYHDLTGAYPANLSEGVSLELQDLLGKAYGLAEIGHVQEALAEYDRALTLAPESEHVWARKGRAHRVAGAFPEAIQALRRALEINPRFAWAWRQLGVALDKAGQTGEALAAFRTALDLRPSDSWSALNLARLLHRLGADEEALSILQTTTERDPAMAAAWALSGQLLGQIGQFDDALNAYDQALTIKPTDAATWKAKGKLLRQAGRLEEAVGALRQAATLDRGREAAFKWYLLGDTLRELKRYVEALGAAQQANRLHPSNGHGWALQADALLHLGRVEEALIATDQALRYRPDDPWNHRVRGALLDRMGRHTDALDAYDSALRFAPGDAWAWQGRAKVLTRIGRKAEARQSFRQAADHAPNSTRFWLNQAGSLLRLGADSDALSAAEQAIMLTPESGEAYRTHGAIQLARGRVRHALESYRTALRHAPKDPDAWAGQGAAYLALNEPRSALDSYDSAVGYAPRRVAYRLARIEPLLRLGQIDAALDAAESLTRAAPEWTRAWSALGRVLRRADRHLDAVDAYDRALALDPANAEAWNGKGRAYRALGDEAQAAFSFEQGWQGTGIRNAVAKNGVLPENRNS